MLPKIKVKPYTTLVRSKQSYCAMSWFWGGGVWGGVGEDLWSRQYHGHTGALQGDDVEGGGRAGDIIGPDYWPLS